MIRLALTELVRAPRRFAPTVVTLATVAFLALSVAGLADGLLRASTGSLRNTDADLFVFADGAQRSVLRSMLPDVLVIPITFQTGVAGAGSMGFAPTAVRVPDQGDEQAVMAISVSHAFPGQPRQLRAGRLPFDGEPRVAAIDDRLATGGLGVGDHLLVDGAFTVEVVGIVRDASYLLRPTIWLPPSEFATIRNAALPEFELDESLTSVIAVRLRPGADPAEVALAIDEAFEEALAEREELADLEGGIETVTAQTAYRAIPGVAAQQSTLRAIVVVVLVVAGAVVAIFLALLAVERRPVLAVLLASGIRLRTVLAVIAVQAGACALAGALVGTTATALLIALLPPAVPMTLAWASVALVVVGTPTAALAGTLAFSITLRGLDPAQELLAGR